MEALTPTAVMVALIAAAFGVAIGIVIRRAFSRPAPGGLIPEDLNHRVLVEAQTLAHVGGCRFDLPSGRAVWSDEMYRIAGLGPGIEPPGFWAFPGIVHPDDRDAVRRGLHEAAGGMATFDEEFRIVRPDGSVKSVRGTGRRESDDEGNVVHLFGAFVEIEAGAGEGAGEGEKEQGKTEPEPEPQNAPVAAPVAARAEAETALTEARSELAEAQSARVEAETARTKAELESRVKSEFLAVTSHELRTPLNSILGFAEILKQQMFGSLGSERYVDYARDIHESGEHLLNVVNDILDLSKVEAGRMELEEETLDLLEVMRDCITLVQERAQELGIILKTTVPQNISDLKADGRMVRQMLINLIANAIDFTPRGGWISVSADDDPMGGITLTVEDTGVGIAAEDLNSVLTPFHTQGKYAKSELFTPGPDGPQGTGTGLGLPLVKSLIELHGGTFQLHSTPGEGTKVTLRFPPQRTVALEVERIDQAS